MNTGLLNLRCEEKFLILFKKLRWARRVVRMEERIDAYGDLVWKPKGRRLPGRPGRTLEDNIKMDL